MAESNGDDERRIYLHVFEVSIGLLSIVVVTSIAVMLIDEGYLWYGIVCIASGFVIIAIMALSNHSRRPNTDV